MSRGSKVFRPTDLPESNSSGYPAPFRDVQRKRWNRRLGDHGGLKNYGINFVRVEAGGQSSARHSHTKQDEFVYIIEGEFVLVTDAGRETVGPGTCIAFPAGTGDGHQFLNATDNDAAFLVVGDRTPGDEVKVLAWLTRHPRWTFHFAPTSASWLNAVENFFSKMTRQRIRRGVFRSIATCRPLSMLISPSTMPAPNRSSRPNPPTLFWPNSTAVLDHPFDSVH
jgi:uncharacterized cupin superfamily protein